MHGQPVLHDSTDMSKMAQPKNATSRMKEMEYQKQQSCWAPE
jgi:hypothetical protein